MSTQKHLNKSFAVGIFFGILHQFSERNISAEKDTYVWMSMYCKSWYKPGLSCMSSSVL